MTRSSQALIICAVLSAAFAVAIRSRPGLAAALSIGAFLCADGLMFLIMVRAVRRLRITRHIAQGGEHAVVFAGTAAAVRVDIDNPTPYVLRVSFEDPAPTGPRLGGTPRWDGPLGARARATVAYTLTGGTLATYRFHTLRVTLASPCGLWRAERAVEAPGALKVVPDIFAKHFLTPWRKTRNVLLQHGRHLHGKPGLGAELRSLRDYQDGDPLKAVAWRASARRDRLLTKEFENEVPVRVRLVLQPSLRMFLDRPAAVTEAAFFLARAARLLAEHRDLVELVVPYPCATHRTGLGLTRRHLGKVLSALGEAAEARIPFPGPLTAGELCAVSAAALAAAPRLMHAAELVCARRFRFGPLGSDPASARLLLALFLSVRFELGVGAVALLVRNAPLLGYYARMFAAAEGGVTLDSSTHAAEWALLEASAWGRRLHATLEHLITHARDEELLVVVADVALLPADARSALARLLSHARVTGHRAVVLWPDIPRAAGPLGDVYRSRTGSLEGFHTLMRTRGIPCASFQTEGSFTPLLAQLERLHRARRTAAW